MPRPPATMTKTGQGAPINSGSWAIRIRIARAFTKPVTTDRDTNRISAPSLANPAPIWKTPVNSVAASRYWSPCSRTRTTITSAMAPVAAEIIAGRPPANAVTTAMQNEAYRPTFGSTPAMIENAIASGMSARATTRPESRSAFGWANHSVRSESSVIRVRIVGQCLVAQCSGWPGITARPRPR